MTTSDCISGVNRDSETVYPCCVCRSRAVGKPTKWKERKL